jgi:hypothetical protein
MKFVNQILNKFNVKRVPSNKGTVTMNFAFTGLSGKKYYHYTDAANDMNPARYIEYYLPTIKEYFLGIKNNELIEFWTKCEGFTSIKQYEAAHLVMKERSKLNIDMTLIYDIMSILYLREDEPNNFVSQILLREKAEDIKNTMRASGGADNGFFLCPEFRNFLKSARLSGIDWKELTKLSEQTSIILSQTLDLIRSSITSKNIIPIQKT